MIYSKDEIQSQFRDAKNKTKQIGILAEMNCCSKKEMREYLRTECGFDVAEPGCPPEKLAELRERKKANAGKKKELPPVVDDIPITDEVTDDLVEDVKNQLNPILVVTPDMIKSKAFTYMVEFFNEDAPKDYIEGFMYGVSMVLGMIQ